MKQARIAFKNGLIKEQAETFYKPEFEYLQMRQARIAFENGLIKEQVETFYKIGYSSEQIEQTRRAFEQALPATTSKQSTSTSNSLSRATRGEQSYDNKTGKIY